MERVNDLDHVRSRFRRFADEEAWPASPSYARLARAVASDDALTRFVAQLPDTQPNLLFAVVQYLHGHDAMPRDGAALRDALARHRDEVVALASSRRVQTNEVGRCAVVVPALPAGPLALLEVGASAGLCLLLEHYRYRWDDVTVGPDDATFTLACRTSGPAPIPKVLPEIVWRRGVDLAPVDVRDPDATRWLRACVWADQPERRARLEAALDVARRLPPIVERGDLVAEVGRLAAAAPPDARLVVMHGGVLPYLPQERRRAFVAALAAASRRRPIVWISNEAPGVVFEWPREEPRPRAATFLLGRVRLEEGVVEEELLACAHPHGDHLAWFPPSERRPIRGF
jgi:hypothetical protein